ncbi:MAG: hypothetical protein E6R08_10170 [Nevskiaceae bacterium]|nr:MAG: hypothetical protein E6R08_10170 [Nevskiaceae bacterium]
MKGRILCVGVLALCASGIALADSNAEFQKKLDANANNTASLISGLKTELDADFNSGNKSGGDVNEAAVTKPEDVEKKVGDTVFKYLTTGSNNCASQNMVSDDASFTEKRIVAEKRVECAKQLAATIKLAASRLDKPAQIMAMNTVADTLVSTTEEEAKNPTSEDVFMGLTWGLGFGYSFGNGARIDAADIDSAGVVRATSNKKQLPRVLFEYHEYIFSSRPRGKLVGNGPFVAVSSSDSKVLSGVAMGWMAGIKTDPKSASGYSLGVGALLDASVKDLADGFHDGQPAPGGATTVRFNTHSAWSALVFVTRSWDL